MKSTSTGPSGSSTSAHLSVAYRVYIAYRNLNVSHGCAHYVFYILNACGFLELTLGNKWRRWHSEVTQVQWLAS